MLFRSATIKEADIKADMFAMAGDAMRGREAGTLDEMRASMWVADHQGRPCRRGERRTSYGEGSSNAARTIARPESAPMRLPVPL